MDTVLEATQQWNIYHGDCIPHMRTMPAESIDFSVYSPPFPAMFAYTDSPSDIGNVDVFNDESKLHLSFFYKAIFPLIKPGRVMMVHVAQIPRYKRSGEVGLCDFRGINIRIAERAGFIFEYDWQVPKNPQAQAIRTRSRELQFVGLEADRAKSRGALPDFLLKFRKPGENAVPIDSPNQVTRNNWIEWAESAWYGIRETHTLNTEEAKGEQDTKHICPLQLQVIDRLVRLYSNPGEIVFSPFAGVGSELYVALKLGRRAYGCELKDEYYKTALKNCRKAEEGFRQATESDLTAGVGDWEPEPVAVPDESDDVSEEDQEWDI